MKNLFLISLLLVSAIALKAQTIREVDALVDARFVEKEITVGGSNGDISGFDNQSIQYAIDAVAKTGGTVKLNAGEFEITGPVRMRSNVKLVGSGKQTVLKRGKGFQSPLVVDADYGELKLTVENAEGFETGMKVQIRDKDNGSCWGVSAAYVTDIRDNTIYIDNYLIRDYRADHGGIVSNASSVIEVMETENVIISDLTVDGNRTENFPADGCNGAGIMIFKSKKVTVEGVHVKDFNGEGISWQITENVTVRNNEISGNGKNGMHPGSGSPFTIIENNNVHHNDNDGLYVCWRVYESQVSNNKFYSNGRFGICTGHKDTDVTFTANHIYSNKDDGVHLRGEREANAPHNNTFEKNIIENNGAKGSGYGFSINSPARNLVLKENIFKSSGKQTQKAAVYIYANGLAPKLINNEMQDHPTGEVVHEIMPK